MQNASVPSRAHSSVYVWQVLSRVVSGERLASQADVGSQLKSFVAGYLQTAGQDLEQDHAFVAGLMKGPSNLHSIESLHDRAYDRVASEIDLLC